MNGRKAKRIRHIVYGEDDYRDRNYYKHGNIGNTIVSDEKRQEYQWRKKIATRGE